MHWQKIIETYSSLPEGERTSVRIAAQLRAVGHEANSYQICDVLKHTVLEDCINIEDIRTTAKVLQTLVDFTVTRPRPDEVDESIYQIVFNVMDGLPRHSPEHYEPIRQIRNALSHIVNFHYEAQQRADQLAEISSLHVYEDEGRYAMPSRNRHTVDDFLFPETDESEMFSPSNQSKPDTASDSVVGRSRKTG